MRLEGRSRTPNDPVLRRARGGAAAGGGLKVDRSARAGLDHVAVTDNQATGTTTCARIDELNIDLGCSASASDGLIGGGGIYSGGTLSMNASTVSGNRAAIDAAGCHQEPFVFKAVTYTATVCVSTEGGGVTSWGHLGIVNSTISGNQAGSAAAQVDAGGFGDLLAAPSTLASYVVSSTIADNGRPSVRRLTVRSRSSHRSSPARRAPHALGRPIRHRTTGTSAAMPHAGSPASTTSTDPQLGPLADNGGPTLTHLPALTSPAVGPIGRGTPGLCDGTIADQRDLAVRPHATARSDRSNARPPTPDICRAHNTSAVN